MLRVTMCLTMLLSSFGMTMEVQAAEVPVAAFPANSGVVIRIGDLDATMKKVNELTAAVEPDVNKRQMMTTYLNLANGMSGTIIDNPARAGVKKGTDWWIAAIAKGGSEPPTMIIAVETDDVAAVKDAVGDSYSYVEYQNWLLYSKDEDAAKAVQACVSGDAPNIEPAADDTTKSIFKDSDVAVFVNIKELAKTYQNELQQARDQATQALAEAENFSPQVEGMDMKAVFDMYRDLFFTLLTAIEESNSCTVGMTVSAEGIHFDEYLNVMPDTATSTFLASHPKATMDALNMLPAEQPVYVGVRADMAALTKWGMSLVKSMMAGDEETAAKLDDALEQVAKLEYGTYVSSFGLGDLQTGLLRSATVSEIKNAKQSREMTVDVFKAMSTLNNPLIQQTFHYKKDAETVAGESVDTITVEQEFNEEIDPTGLQKQMMEKLYGPGGAVTRMVYLDNHIVQTMGGGTEALEAVLKTVKSPAADEAVQATRGKLAAEANLVALVDLSGLLIRGVYIAAETGLFDPTLIPEFDIDRSYLGYSVAMSKEGIDIDAEIPAEQIRGLYLIGMAAFMMWSAQ